MSRESRDRHCWGETNSLYCLTANDATIYTGDMLYMSGNYVYPMAYATASKANDTFCGVAMQDAVDKDPTTIRVATDGVFEFDTSDTFIIGEGVYQGASNAQTVYGIGDRSTVTEIIGRAWKRYPSSTTKVWVKIDTREFFTPAA